MFSITGARPAATSTMSVLRSFFSPPASTVIETESLAAFTFEILAPVRIVIPRFLNARSTSLDASGVLERRTFGMTSISVTWEPKALKTSANSQPTAPAPTMDDRLGRFLEDERFVRRDDGRLVQLEARPGAGRGRGNRWR
jgi:hypothetical protein